MIRRDVNRAKICVDRGELNALNLSMGEESPTPGVGAPAAMSPSPTRTIPPPRPGIGRPAATSVASLSLELKQKFDDLQAAAILADERSVRRHHRQWIGWIREREARHAPAMVVAVEAARLHADTVALILAEKAAGEPVVEFVPTSAVIADIAPWPQLPAAALPDGMPLDVRVILVRDLAGLANRPDLVNHMRREAGLALIEQGVVGRCPTDFLDFMPAATFVVVDGEELLARRGDPARRHVMVSAPAAMTLGPLIDRVIPAAVRTATRPLVAIADAVGLADGLDQQSAPRREGDAASSLANLEHDLGRRLEGLTAARVEMASAIKACVATLRKGKQDIDAAKIVKAGDKGQLAAFLEKFEPHSTADISPLMDVKPRRTWWEGTWLEGLKPFFNRKSRHSLDTDAVDKLIEGVERLTLEQIGDIVQKATDELETTMAKVEQAYVQDGIEEATRNCGVKRISKREVLGDEVDRRGSPRVVAAGAVKARLTLVGSIRQSVRNSFRVFANKEASSFYVDIDEKGFIGQLTEARSGVFGIFFVLLFFARPFQRSGKEDACQIWDKTGFFDAKGHFDLNYGLDCMGFHIGGPIKAVITLLTFAMIFVTLASFAVNRHMKPRRSRLALIERFEPRVEELRNKTADLVERVVREEIARFELATEDQGAVADATFDRLISEVKAQIDETKAASPGGQQRGAAAAGSALAGQPPRAGFGGVTRGSMADECRKLQEKLREAYFAEICQGAT